MMKKLSTPNAAFTLLQVLTCAIMLVGLGIAASMLCVGGYAAMRGAEALHIPQGSYMMLLIFGFLSIVVVSGACAGALVIFFRLCSRLKRGAAFTRVNERAMLHITRCCLTAGGMLVVSCIALYLAELIWGGAMGLYWIELAIFACCFLAVAAVTWALCLLVHRAIPLQEDADLTI